MHCDRIYFLDLPIFIHSRLDIFRRGKKHHIKATWLNVVAVVVAGSSDGGSDGGGEWMASFMVY